ncbi:flavin-containing monooxygenase [Microbacterium sp. SLBN-154]|uniref:flavin-containing monooxygenase n=1 Tax=Microbacterium sp. SLBN-154 TaxID=2768458 RepID=UPI00190FA358|nr:NAD(P)/FAD-dependent oxidoreductase [Microbacterium sp. SLBN-154]
MKMVPRVAVIGAGFGGVAAAHSLQQSGAVVTLYERADRVGGVWRDNDYPGAACDVPSHLYSFSFAPKEDWTRRFAPQAEIRQYIEDTVDAVGLRSALRTNQTLISATWDDVDGSWLLRFASGLEDRCDILVPALGQMSTPHTPAIPGAVTFAGATFHSARWDHSVDLAGKRVVVIGSGASIVQIVPAIADAAASVSVIQRSPGYVLEKGDHPYQRARSRIGARLRRWRDYIGKEVRTPRLVRFPKLVRPVERQFRRDIEQWVRDPELRAKVTPADRFGCKRILVSNDWYPTLQRDDVHLVNAGIAAIEPDAVVTTEGQRLPADVIVYGTGFRTQAFLSGIDVRGRGGRPLADAWAENPSAYLGMGVPDFPNLFLVYGPNTNPAWNSVLVFLEWQAQYIARIARAWRRRGPLAMDPTPEATGRFVADMKRRSARSVWVTGCANWYVDDTGVNTQNWPGLATAYWLLTRRIAWRDYCIARVADATRASDGVTKRQVPTVSR